jgi:hypothetical protein
MGALLNPRSRSEKNAHGHLIEAAERLVSLRKALDDGCIIYAFYEKNVGVQLERFSVQVEAAKVQDAWRKFRSSGRSKTAKVTYKKMYSSIFSVPSRFEEYFGIRQNAELGITVPLTLEMEQPSDEEVWDVPVSRAVYTTAEMEDFLKRAYAAGPRNYNSKRWTIAASMFILLEYGDFDELDSGLCMAETAKFIFPE